MNRKVIMLISLMLLVGLAVFVSAKITLPSETDSGYNIEIPMEKGWNLIVGTPIYGDDSLISSGSEIKESDIRASYYYLRKDSVYLQAYPKKAGLEIDDYLKNWQAEEDEMSYFAQSPYWVYSSKSGNLKYHLYDLEDSHIFTTGVVLSAGWNFVTVFPQFADKRISDFKGSCKVKKAYGFDSNTQTWEEIDIINTRFKNADAGLGMVVKVENDCKFGVVSEEIPSLPSIP